MGDDGTASTHGRLEIAIAGTEQSRADAATGRNGRPASACLRMRWTRLRSLVMVKPPTQARLGLRGPDLQRLKGQWKVQKARVQSPLGKLPAREGQHEPGEVEPGVRRHAVLVHQDRDGPFPRVCSNEPAVLIAVAIDAEGQEAPGGGRKRRGVLVRAAFLLPAVSLEELVRFVRKAVAADQVVAAARVAEPE